MKVEYHLALVAGRLVVIEKYPDLPVVVHIFDSSEEAVQFYEERRSKPLPAAKRQRIMQTVKAGLQ